MAWSCDRVLVVSFLRRLLCMVRKRPGHPPCDGLQPMASSRIQSSAEKHFWSVGTSTGAAKKMTREIERSNLVTPQENAVDNFVA